MTEQKTTLYPLSEHPLRTALADEIRARPYEPLRAPIRASYLAVVSGEDGYRADFEHVESLCRLCGAATPEMGRDFFATTLESPEGDICFRWERHTEFSSYLFSTPGDLDPADPFTDPVIRRLPVDWLLEMPGKVLVATHLVIEPKEAPERSIEDISALFGGNTMAGSFMSRGRARVWTDFRLHEDGFSRILMHDVALDSRAAGRMVQRLLEISTYRMMALLTLPEARRMRPQLATAERLLADIIARTAAAGGVNQERQLLKELTGLAAEMESLSSRMSYRLAATRAYYDLVKRRVKNVMEERIPGIQPPAEFVNRRLHPAVATCFSVGERLDDVSRRIARASDLLRTRVDVAQEEQTRELLASMDRRAQMQIRLQQTVEGLSVVAISYYLTGLIAYMAKGIKAMGYGVNPDIAAGAAFPIVLVAVWFGIRRLRRAIMAENPAKDA